MNSSKSESFTAADSLPIKLIQSFGVQTGINGCGYIPPVHVQYTPTNKCNLKCDFCSCAEDDRNTEMSFNTFLDMMKQLRALGTRAVTITGGGEPTLHPDFCEMIKWFEHSDIAMGLVTNGLTLATLPSMALNKLTWCRVSHGDFRGFKSPYKRQLIEAMQGASEVDWAFSYVVSPNPVFNTLQNVIQFANKYGMTHVRLVADLHQTEAVDMTAVKNELKTRGVDDSKVIYQGRNKPERGARQCYMGYLKPVIDAHGDIYACCGSQYAIKNKPKRMHDELCMGNIDDLHDLVRNGIGNPIDGSVCDVCYYGDYNRVLKAMVTDVEHKEFV